MKRLSYLLLPVLLGSLMISWNPPAKTKKKSAPEIKNIIFMIILISLPSFYHVTNLINNIRH